MCCNGTVCWNGTVQWSLTSDAVYAKSLQNSQGGMSHVETRSTERNAHCFAGYGVLDAKFRAGNVTEQPDDDAARIRSITRC